MPLTVSDTAFEPILDEMSIRRPGEKTHFFVTAPNSEGQGADPHFATVGPRSDHFSFQSLAWSAELTSNNSHNSSPALLFGDKRMQISQHNICEKSSGSDWAGVAGRENLGAFGPLHIVNYRSKKILWELTSSDM